MPLNDGERQALLTQVNLYINAAEVKLRQLGLATVKVGLYDEVTRLPMNHQVQMFQMAEGQCLACVAGPPVRGLTAHTDECQFNPDRKLTDE